MGWNDHDEAAYLGYRLVPGVWVCGQCIGEEYLRDIVESDGTPEECSYCHENADHCVAVSELIPVITRGILSEYEDAANSVGYCSDEGGYLLETMDSIELIEKIFEDEDMPLSLMEDLASAIPDCAWVKQDPYVQWRHSVLLSAWDKFSAQVKHHCRFMFYRLVTARTDDPGESQEPYEILQDLGEIVNDLGLVSTLSKGDVFSRVRVHDKKMQLATADDLGPPPDQYAGANRMSPAGISVFYGADSLKTAVMETFDTDNSKGKVITCAEFQATRDLLVLDFLNLPGVPSLFDEDRSAARYLVIFLHNFIREVTQPIAKDGRVHIDYVPTQVVAEYFRHVFRDYDGSVLDGIRYPSARVMGGYNCVIFTKHGEINDAAQGHCHPEAKLEIVNDSVKRITPTKAVKLMEPLRNKTNSLIRDGRLQA